MIRRAEAQDFGAVSRIRESLALDIGRLSNAIYRLQIQRSGFLLPDDTSEEEFASTSDSYELAEQDNKVLGYVRLVNEQDISEHEVAYWYKPEMKAAYYADPHAYVAGIGVLPESKGQGIAAELLKAAERRVRAQEIPWLFSEIVASPVTNIASMIFHEKNGFQRVAIGRPREVVGIRGFYEILYAKQLA